MKVINFYKDNECNINDLFLYSHNDTIKAIEQGVSVIHTFAISALDFSHLLDLGYVIKLHENNKWFEIKEGNVEGTDKEIRKQHDIRRIWIGGGFKNYFYN